MSASDPPRICPSAEDWPVWIVTSPRRRRPRGAPEAVQHREVAAPSRTRTWKRAVWRPVASSAWAKRRTSRPTVPNTASTSSSDRRISSSPMATSWVRWSAVPSGSSSPTSNIPWSTRGRRSRSRASPARRLRARVPPAIPEEHRTPVVQRPLQHPVVPAREAVEAPVEGPKRGDRRPRERPPRPSPQKRKRARPPPTPREGAMPGKRHATGVPTPPCGGRPRDGGRAEAPRTPDLGARPDPEAGRHRGEEGERHRQRGQEREGHRQREVPEELPGHPLHVDDGAEDRDGGEGGGGDGPGDLLRPRADPSSGSRRPPGAGRCSRAR
jgi:hypothetical protein